MARENMPRANMVQAVQTAYQNIAMTDGNNLSKRPIYTGCLYDRCIFRTERLTSVRAYRSPLQCLGQGSTARNV
jgi:hypothetical protein